MIETSLQVLLQGLLLGGLYCLFALGQSLMFGVMRLTNTAQGDFIILGAFAAIAGTRDIGFARRECRGHAAGRSACCCCHWHSASVTRCSDTC